jgi:hypothetical protein
MNLFLELATVHSFRIVLLVFRNFGVYILLESDMICWKDIPTLLELDF